MRGQWEFYICPVDNYLASIALDIGLAEELPLEKMDWLIAVSVELQQPVEGGFTSPEEHPILSEMEEKLAAAIKNEAGGIQVGRVTGGGTRDILFYVPSGKEMSRIVEEVMEKFPHKYKIHQQEEPKWATYWEFLYPNPWQIKMIENRHLIEQLAEQGDSPEIERPVDHYLYFTTEEKVILFKEEVESWGKEWRIVEINEVENEEFPWSVHVVCQQPTDLISVNQRSGRLFEAAYNLGGQYDGWGTVICKKE